MRPVVCDARIDARRLTCVVLVDQSCDRKTTAMLAAVNTPQSPYTCRGQGMTTLVQSSSL